jgi:hypothetical protein
MKNFNTILYQIIDNSTEILIIILSTFVGLYKVWQNFDKIKENIVMTVIYSILFIFGILKIAHINILMVIFCLKKRIKAYKMVSIMQDIDQTFYDILEDSGNRQFLSELNDNISSIKNKIDIIKNKVEENKKIQNSTIQINNNNI